MKGTEANKAESKELNLAVSKSDERRLELLDMVKGFAFLKYGFYAIA